MKILNKFEKAIWNYYLERDYFVSKLKEIIEKEGSYKVSKFMNKDGSYVRKAITQNCSDDVLIKIIKAIIKMREEK